MTKILPAEAVYGFAAWLTTREEITRLGSNCDCAPLMSLLKAYLELNKITEVRDVYPNNLKYPKI